jgi:mannose-6-phosphate isomerase-like protein (cupin superfamily)
MPARRSLLAAAAILAVVISAALIPGLAFPLRLIAAPPSQSAGLRVGAGQDRYGKHRQVGVSTTTFKVSGGDTAGGLFVIEQANVTKGGPPRHLHYDQDEFWYVLAGDYIFEIGSERYALKAGDSILGPRRIPHAWAFVGDSPGRLLIAFTPAGKMQENFERDRKAGEYRSDAEAFRAYGMELVGPPLAIK